MILVGVKVVVTGVFPKQAVGARRDVPNYGIPDAGHEVVSAYILVYSVDAF